MARPVISPALAADIYGNLHCTQMQFVGDSYYGPTSIWFTLKEPVTRKELLEKIRERKAIAEKYGNEPWTFTAEDVIDRNYTEDGLVKEFQVKGDPEGGITKLIWSYLRCAFHDPAYKNYNILDQAFNS